MALVAGDVVASGSALTFLPFAGMPLFGVVESTGPTVVDWSDGSVVSYAADTYLFGPVTQSATALGYYHRRVLLNGASNVPADAKAVGSSEGIVIAVFTIAGTDYAVVQYTSGDISGTPVSNLIIID